MTWKRRITSTYSHPTNYLGGRLRLIPGVNRVGEELFTEAKRDGRRLTDQIVAGKITDDGYQADWIAVQLINDPAALSAVEVNAIAVEEAKALVGQFKDNGPALQVLAKLAEKGGISQVFRSALEGVSA